jgi:hypothetical protein
MAVKGKNGMVKGGSWPGRYSSKYQSNWYYKGRVYSIDDEEFYIALSSIGKELYAAAFSAHLCESITTSEELDNFIEKVLILKEVALRYYNFVDKNKGKMIWVNPSLLTASFDVIKEIDGIQVSKLPYKFAVIHRIEEKLRFFKYFIVEGTFVAGKDNYGVPIDLCDLPYKPIAGIGDFLYN